MTIGLRLLLFVTSLITLSYVMRKIRKSQMQIYDSIYWICFLPLLILFSAMPQIANMASVLIGVDSPANLVFLLVIFVLMLKIFFQSIKLSQMDYKIKGLAQKMALDNKAGSSCCCGRETNQNESDDGKSASI